MRFHHTEIGIDYFIYGQAITRKAVMALVKKDLRPSVRHGNQWIESGFANSKQVVCAITSSAYKREDKHWPVGQLTPAPELKCASFDEKHEVYHAVGPIVPKNRGATQ
jgi:hypothetical protein